MPLHSKARAWAEYSSTVKLVGVCSSVFLSDFDTFEGIIHSLGSASGQQPRMFINHKFGVC